MSSSLHRLVSRASSVVLVLSLLCNSVPAAPRTMVAFATEWPVSLAFWLRANELPAKLHRLFAGQSSHRRLQERQQDRDTRVSRIRIHPGDLTLRLDERVNLAAVAYDQDDGPVGGVQFTWEAQDEDRNDAAVVSPQGEFEALAPGRYRVTVQGAGRTDHIRVTVLDGQRRRKDEGPLRTTPTSTKDQPSATSARSGPTVGKTRAERGPISSAAVQRSHAASPAPPMPAVPADGWNGSNYWSADDPGNVPGTPPGAPLDGGAGSGNFQFSAPIYTAPGRGLSMSLEASYNSRLWNKATSQITYDIDRGWPAPGWSLGFGKVLGMGGSGFLILDADGTRHPFAGTLSTYSGGSLYFSGHTTDGSLIDYTVSGNTDGSVTNALASLPNGTQISYGAPGPGAVYPTSIEDANGNFLTITYVNNTGPRIQTITDTLGRALTFYYDSNNLLTAIQAPGYDNGPARTLARFHYKQLSLSYSFPTLSVVVRDSYPWVLDAIYYPGTNTGYWFGDSSTTGYSFGTTDSYSSYGMLAKVVEVRGMTFSGPDPIPATQGSTAQGTITSAGLMSRKERYNYPLYLNDPSGTASTNLTDAPTYTSQTDSWIRDGTTEDSATRTYVVNEVGNPRTVAVTLPNGTTNRQYSYNAPGQFNDGLVYRDETYADPNIILQSSTASWELGVYDTPRPTQLQATNNEIGQTTSTAFTYGSVYNQVIDVRNYGYSGELLRSSRTTYVPTSTGYYVANHIFNLPSTVEIYDGANNRLTRTEYQYDGQTLANVPSQYVAQHDLRYNPYAPQYWVPTHCDQGGPGGCVHWVYGHYESPYNPVTAYRGNITSTTTYANVTTGSATSPIPVTRKYDINGNLVISSSSCCDQTSFNFTSNTQYAYPESQTRGSATDAYAQVVTSSTFDFNTGLARSTTDANGRLSSMGYSSSTLRPASITNPSNSHIDYTYDDSGMSLTETTYLAASEGGALAGQTVKFLNGLGQVWREKALGAGSVWDFVDTAYDNMGRVSQQSRPYRSGDTLQWNTTTYDALGRAFRATEPDGSVSEIYYNEKDPDLNDGYAPQRPNVASSSPGETTLLKDAWGRERWGRTDANGRLVEVVEPNPSGNGSTATSGLVTTYGYDTLGQLTTASQGSETRSFKYDSLGRLLAQKLAETNATLNDAGAYVGSGTWSNVFTYDDHSNVTSETDARGVKTVYNYLVGGNLDPLNRLQSVSWDTSGFGDTANPISSAASLSYSYRTKDNATDLKDVTQLASVATSGVSTEGFGFDTEGRVTTRTLTVTNRASFPFVTDYTYDSLDRATDVRYPAEYLNGSQPRKVIHQDYDVASRLSSLTYGGQSFASSIVYNAASQTTSLNVGASGPNQIAENYTYEAQTGRLSNQTVVRGGSTTLLNLAYDYNNGSGKRTGQLTKILNNLDHNKDRSYSYDAVGRLIQAQGGINGALWTQTYAYDRYGNRTNVSASGYSAQGGGAPSAKGELASASTSAGKSGGAMASPSDPKVELPTDLLARNNSLELPDTLRPRDGAVSDSPPALYSSGSPGANNNGPANLRSPTPPIPTDGTSGTMNYDVMNHITNAGFAYDAAGNQVRAMAAGGVFQRFKYDAANRLAQVRADDNTTVLATYTYGDSNERLVSEEWGLRTYYVSEDGITVAEYFESGSSTSPGWTKSYVYLGDRLLSTLAPNGSGGEATQFQHPDRLGTRLVTDPAAGSSFEQVALPFGTPLNAESTGSTNRRFTSYDRNPTTGLDYAVNRHYDPQQGRFTQVDPAGMRATNLWDPQTLNLFAYCANDPVNRTDPNGLGFFSFLKKVFKWLVVAAAIVAAVITIVTAGPLFAGVLMKALGIVAAVANAAQSLLSAIGLKKAAAIFGIISAAATFGTSLLSIAGLAGAEKLKMIFKAVKDGASFASQTLTAFGKKKLGQIFDLVSSAAGFISDGFKPDRDSDDEIIDHKFHFQLTKFEIFKFVRGTAERVATLAGEERLSGYLNILGLVDDIGDLYLGIRHFNKDEPGRNTTKRVPGYPSFLWVPINKQIRLLARVTKLFSLGTKVNTAFGRIDKAVALAH